MGYNSPLARRLGLVELCMVVVFWKDWKDPPEPLISWVNDRAKNFHQWLIWGAQCKGWKLRRKHVQCFLNMEPLLDVCRGWMPLVWCPRRSWQSLAFLVPEQDFQLFLIQILTVYLGDRPAGKKRRFWFRGACKPARPLSPSAPARCGASPVKQDCSAGRKGLCLCRTAPKPAQLSAPATPLPHGKSPSKSDPPVGRRGLPQDVLVCPPAHLLPPAVPLLHWPAEQKTPGKQERVLLTWPQFPTSAHLLCRNQRHRYEQGTVAQPLPPAAPKLMVWGQGPIKRAPLQASKDYTNSRPLCCPAGPCLWAYVHSLESSPGRRGHYWFWRDEGRNISPLLEVFELLSTEIC